ncbi:tetratricopeptide repeat protein [Clostridium sp.]|uniref:tetratricopeptide repeat protein n=1 Tax=Clostridium sp. TaxID=1506 RepID=UPI003D6D2A3C
MKKAVWSKAFLAVAFILLILIGGIALAQKKHADINQTQNKASNTGTSSKADSENKTISTNNANNVKGTNSTSTKIYNSDNNNLQTAQKQLQDKYEKGYNAFFKGDYKTAIKLENEVIHESPDFYKAYNLKGIALCYSGDFKNGMANIDKSLSMKSDFGYALFNKGLAYELYGYYDNALLWYNKDLQVENYVWTYYGISSIYGRRGDVSNTIKYLKIAISLNPGIKEMAKTEKDFNNVKNYDEFQSLIKS